MQNQKLGKIGFWPVTSLVTGNLVGSGAFMLPATLAMFGSVSILGWLITSIGAIFLALVFAKLGEKIPKVGGPHAYVRSAFGDNVAFYVAFGYWVLSWISNAAVVVTVVGYLSTLLGGLSIAASLAIELFIIVFFAGVNLIGIKFAGRFGVVLTALKLLPLLIVPVIGLFFIDFANMQPLNPSDYSLTKALSLVAFVTIWGFIGLETGTVPGSEIIDPQKTIPRATIFGTIIAALVYILGTITVIGVIPRAELLQSTAPYGLLATHIFGGHWGEAISIAAVLCALGTFNGWTLVVGRIAYGAACDNLFPKFFKKTTKSGAPLTGILVSALCTTPLLFLTMKKDLLEQFNYIIDLSITLILIMYLVCVAAYMKLICARKTRTVLELFIGIIALAFGVLALFVADFKMLLLSLIIVVCGVPLRLWLQLKNK